MRIAAVLALATTVQAEVGWYFAETQSCLALCSNMSLRCDLQLINAAASSAVNTQLAAIAAGYPCISTTLNTTSPSPAVAYFGSAAGNCKYGNNDTSCAADPAFPYAHLCYCTDDTPAAPPPPTPVLPSVASVLPPTTTPLSAPPSPSSSQLNCLDGFIGEILCTLFPFCF